MTGTTDGHESGSTPRQSDKASTMAVVVCLCLTTLAAMLTAVVAAYVAFVR